MERELSPVQMRGSCPLCKNLPYHTKQRDDVISTKTKETNLATNSATRCCCVSVLTPFTVASLDHTYSLPHEADMFTRHMHSGNLKLTARGFRRLTSLCLAPCSLYEYQPSNQQGLLRPRARTLGLFARGFLASDVMFALTVKTVEAV